MSFAFNLERQSFDKFKCQLILERNSSFGEKITQFIGISEKEQMKLDCTIYKHKKK